MFIRQFRPEDAPALAALFHASVHEIASRDYSEAQVHAWSPAPPDPGTYLDRAGDGRRLLVAVDDLGVPIGYGDLEPDGRIDHLYCRPEFVDRGVASALLEALEAAARSTGIDELHVEASEAARRLLQRRGFALGARREFEVNGVSIHNYRMTKRL